MGERDHDYALVQTKLHPIEDFAPHPAKLSELYQQAHAALHSLRKLCASYSHLSTSNSDDAVWTAQVHRGSVEKFRRLDKLQVKRLRTRDCGLRLGLLPRQVVGQIRAMT